MQDSAGCDYNRTSVEIKEPDYLFLFEITWLHTNLKTPQ